MFEQAEQSAAIARRSSYMANREDDVLCKHNTEDNDVEKRGDEEEAAEREEEAKKYAERRSHTRRVLYTQILHHAYSFCHAFVLAQAGSGAEEIREFITQLSLAS